MRARAVEGLGFLGLAIDPALNAARSTEARVISPRARSPVLVVPTNEELQIARETLEVVRG